MKKSSGAAPVFLTVTGTVTGVPAASVVLALSGSPAALALVALKAMFPVNGLGQLVAYHRFGEVDDQRPGARHRIEGVGGQRVPAGPVQDVLAVSQRVAVRADQVARRPGSSASLVSVTLAVMSFTP